MTESRIASRLAPGRLSAGRLRRPPLLAELPAPAPGCWYAADRSGLERPGGSRRREERAGRGVPDGLSPRESQRTKAAPPPRQKICPGGGYGGHAIEPEGHGIARWLNGHGITGAVLQYRLPKGRHAVPLLDARAGDPDRPVPARRSGTWIRPGSASSGSRRADTSPRQPRRISDEAGTRRRRTRSSG